ncbi:MAG: PIN domain-containing protein [Opitutaceae bacterium]
MAKGLRLGENDTWQAAVALRFDLTLVTDDTDFDKVPQLKRRNYHDEVACRRKIRAQRLKQPRRNSSKVE